MRISSAVHDHASVPAVCAPGLFFAFSGGTMNVAVTYEDGGIFQHFGHTKQFKLYEVDGGEVKPGDVVSAGGAGHGALAGFLKERGVDVLICGGIGGGAQTALAQAGIRLYGGVSGSADEAVRRLAEGTLACNPNVQCSRHGGHEDGSHQCGGSCAR